MIRRARDDDSAGITALVAACWLEYPGCVVDFAGEAPELFSIATYSAGRGGAAWVAEADGQVVGLACTWPLADGAWEMAKIYVARSQRGGGVAHALVDGAEAFAQAAGATRLCLWSDTRFARAHAFYEKRGYVRAGGLRALDDKSHSIEFGYAKPLTGVAAQRLDVAAAGSAEPALARVLMACVADGAALGFRPPLAVGRARAVWRGVSGGVGRGEVLLVAAWCEGQLVGAVCVDLATDDSRPHRAELTRWMVHPAARRQGVGRALLARAEAEAAAAGRRLLTLAAPEGGAAAALAQTAGWWPCGRIDGDFLDATGLPAASLLFARRIG
jgi:GNAT superfamily N-acetyltransferase